MPSDNEHENFVITLDTPQAPLFLSLFLDILGDGDMLLTKDQLINRERNKLSQIFTDSGIQNFKFLGNHVNVQLEKPSQLLTLQENGYKPKLGHLGAIG